MLKKIFLGFLILFTALLVYYHELVAYGYRQAKGQITMLMNVREVSDVLKDPMFPDSLKSRIRLIEEIKQFGVDSLGLTPSENYTTFYDQHGKALMWMLTASPQFKIEPKKWTLFPIIGIFPYKGFFDSARAYNESVELSKAGWDTNIGTAAAWSTLGYLKDPILSSMLERSEGSLANLILHELTHGTLFVKNNLELNENLASFVGDWGAMRFLVYKFGADSKQVLRYTRSKKYNRQWAEHMLRGARQLDSLYATFNELTPNKTTRISLKREMIGRIMVTADTLMGGAYADRKSPRDRDLPNNAFFINYLTYQSRQNQFQEEFVNRFDSDFKKYFAYLKEKYPSL